MASSPARPVKSRGGRPSARKTAPVQSGINNSSAQASGWRRSEEGSRFAGGCQTTRGHAVKTHPSLPETDPRRRIPASCPFLRFALHQLRVASEPLAASDRRSKGAIPFIVPLQMGRKRRQRDLPTGLADSRDQPRMFLPQTAAGTKQESRGRLGRDKEEPCLPIDPRRTSCLTRSVPSP